MFKNAREWLLFPTMCLLTTGLSSLELRLGTASLLKNDTPGLLEFFAEMFTKPTVWPVDILGLEVTFHSSAFIAGVVASLIAVLAKYKDIPILYTFWLVFNLHGILANQFINAALNCIVAYSSYEHRVTFFMMVVLLMLVEEARFWLVVFQEYMAECKHWPFARERKGPQNSAPVRNDSGDHLVDAGKINVAPEFHGLPGDQGDNIHMGARSEQEAHSRSC